MLVGCYYWLFIFIPVSPIESHDEWFLPPLVVFPHRQAKWLNTGRQCFTLTFLLMEMFQSPKCPVMQFPKAYSARGGGYVVTHLPVWPVLHAADGTASTTSKKKSHYRQTDRSIWRKWKCEGEKTTTQNQTDVPSYDSTNLHFVVIYRTFRLFWVRAVNMATVA